MINNSINETDASSSDDIIGETYSTYERWIIFIVIYVISLIICIVFLFLRIDVKQFSLPLFVLCLIFSSFFVMLNVISMLDLLYSNEVGMVKFVNMISIYYEIFNWIDKALGYCIFNILITMMESGYNSKLKKFGDYLFRIWKRIPNNKCIIIFRLIIAVGILVILYL